MIEKNADKPSTLEVPYLQTNPIIMGNFLNILQC